MNRLIKPFKTTSIFCLGLWVLPPALYAESPHPAEWSSLPNALGWVPSHANICQGIYLQPDIVIKTPNPAKISKQSTTITAEGPTVLSHEGLSILHKNVQVTQPGRDSQADVGLLQRDAKTGRITEIELQGHVKLQEYQKELLGADAKINLEDRTTLVTKAIYRLTGKTPSGETYNAWGTAKSAYRDSQGQLTLIDATFTTCNPLHPSWQLKAKKITFDSDQKKGTAKNAVIHFKNVPIFYSPYYSFSLDRSRKSGFLTPSIGFSNQNGVYAAAPLYLNIAPNYDLTLTPAYYSKRGLMGEEYFRYLNQKTIGNLHATFLPDDVAYEKFQSENAIPGDSNRWEVNFNNHTQLSKKWTLDLAANQVSDSYYFQNFSDNQNLVIANQLLNQAMSTYKGDHWEFTGLFQGYKTLHPTVTQGPVQDQYQRLPELDWLAQYPNALGALGFDLDAQVVNFAFPAAFSSQTAVGQRYHLRPNFSVPMSNAYAYLTPSIYLDYTQYNVLNTVPNIAQNSSRTLPIVSVNNGFYFDKPWHFHRFDLTQTFEPELHYLYVPYRNQNAIPVYDTILLPFTYAQLFSLNRYSGFDRIQNANQLSVGLTSRLIDGMNGNQLLSASVGQIYYFARPIVSIPGAVLSSGSFSPIVAQLTAYPSPHWASSWNYAWDPTTHQTNNNSLDLNYNGGENHLFDVGYDFVYQNGSGYNDFNRVRLSAAWPLFTRWSALGYWYYNITQLHPNSYYAGLQYDTCCWAARVMVSQNEFDDGSVVGGVRPRTTVYFQFQLKGLANVGNNDPSTLFAQTMPNYQNIFRTS